MNIYKLKYADKETAVADLKAKDLLLEEGYGTGVHAIIELGLILLDETTFADGYHYDIMCEQDVDFGKNSIIVNNPKHGFLGH